MLQINILSQTRENGYNLILGEVYMKDDEDNADKYILVTVDEKLNQNIYIPIDGRKPQQIHDSTVSGYRCSNCSTEKETKTYYGCTLEGNDIRNNDIRICTDCADELEELYKTAIDNSLETFLVDVI